MGRIKYDSMYKCIIFFCHNQVSKQTFEVLPVTPDVYKVSVNVMRCALLTTVPARPLPSCYALNLVIEGLKWTQVLPTW
jgi:hypothetical protein